MGKKSFLLALLLFLSTGIYAEDSVVLLLRNGNTVGFAFSEKPVMVTGETLTLKTSGETVAYDYADVARAYFADNAATAVSHAGLTAKSGCVFRLGHSSVEVSGLRKGENVAVYTTGGQLVSRVESADGHASLSLPDGQHQAYVVKTDNGVSFKFMGK